MLRLVLLLASASIASAQQYTITTLAGGAPPSTPVAAGSAAIGQPRRVALDSGGNLYFSAGNSVFKLSGSTLTLVAGNSRPGFSGDGGPAVNAQLNTPYGVAVDKSGNLYIADTQNNRVRVVSGGIIKTFAGTGLYSQGGGPGQYNDGGPAVNALLFRPQGVAVDGNGNVFIADTGDNLLREVTADGIINTIAGDSYNGFHGDTGNASSAEFNHPSDVFVDSSGNIYIADTANARIRKITTDGKIDTIAGSGAVGSTGDGGAPTSAALFAPTSVVVDTNGNFYIVTSGDSRIRKCDTKANTINTIAGTGVAGFSGDGSAATKAQLNAPTGLVLDSGGNLFVADLLNLRVRKVDTSGNINSVAGNGVQSFSGDGGAAVSAQLNSPQGVAVDGAGNVYVSDTFNNVVRRVAKNGTITTFAGNGQAGSNGDGSAAASAQLNSPQGLALDSAGNLYIADTGNAKVRRVTSDGKIATYAGNGTAGYGGDGASATSAQLNTPSGVAVDSAGNLFIADFSNHRVRLVSPTGTITTVAGTGVQGYSGDGGLAANAQLFSPEGVGVDPSGNLLIADTGNSVIRKVTAGAISTIAGNGIIGFAGDGGPATRAQLAAPVAVAADAIGNIYIADGSTRIRRVAYPTGTITTIAGNGSQGYSGDGGAATSAQLNSPAGLAVDSSGNLYVADSGNMAVRAVQASGAGISVSGVVNGASNLTGPISPGQVVVVYGSGLGPATLTQFQLVNGLVPTAVGGTSVYFGGLAGPVLYSSATQVAAVVPYGVSGSSVPVSVVYQAQASAPVNVNVVAATPAIFTLNSSGTGLAAATNQDHSVNGAGNPAAAGSTITFYATGAGQTNPSGQDGLPGTVPLPLPVLPVSIAIGGKAATASYAGQAPGAVAGVIQVNVQIPTGLTPGLVPLVFQVGNSISQSGVTIAVSN